MVRLTSPSQSKYLLWLYQPVCHSRLWLANNSGWNMTPKQADYRWNYETSQNTVTSAGKKITTGISFDNQWFSLTNLISTRLKSCLCYPLITLLNRYLHSIYTSKAQRLQAFGSTLFSLFCPSIHTPFYYFLYHLYTWITKLPLYIPNK